VLVGAKVTWAVHPEYGIAEVVSPGEDQTEIAFFPAPDSRTTHHVHGSDLHRVTIPFQSLGFFRSADGSWRYLRVLQDIDGCTSTKHQTYWVKIGGQTKHELLREDTFHVAADVTSPDPLLAIAALSANSPFFFEARHPLASAIVEQLRLCRALPCLLASRVEIYDHQVEVAQRILTDPLMRYLLADEVGLGKTIEAGLVLKQASIDHPSATLIVVVPDALRIQWRFELDQCFDLERVKIRTHSELDGGEINGTWDIAVIDEAHRLVRNDNSFRAIKELAHKCQHLLLLSATPALHHDAELMRLLHLLDPERHHLDDQEGFRRRLTQRQEIGREVLALSTAQTRFSVRSTTNRLATLLPNDGIVRNEVKKLASETGDHAATKDLLLAHLSETYRLYRRMLRTRRQWLAQSDDHTFVRNLKMHVEYELEDEPPLTLWRLVENWRAEVAARMEGGEVATAIEAYMDIAWAVAAHPSLLPHAIARRRAQAGFSACLEDESLKAMLRTVSGKAQSEEARRFCLVHALLDKALQTGRSVHLIFCSEAETVMALARHLRESLDAVQGDEIYTITHQLAPAKAAGMMQDFCEAELPRILISDQTAEEGFNLHFVSSVIFYDVPWDVMRMEQRIGRIDRISRSGVAIPAYLICSTEDDDGTLAVDEAWRRLLGKECLDIFARPASDLQYAIESLMPGLKKALFEGGPEGLLVRLPSAKDTLDKERLLIEEQDMIDGLHVAMSGSGSGDSDVRKADDAADDFRYALERYMRGCIGLGVWREGNVTEFRRSGDPLVPAHCVERLGSMVGVRTTVFRSVASEDPSVAFLRPGHPAIDQCARLMRLDTRGRAFVMWRQNPDVDGVKVVFRFSIRTALAMAPLEKAKPSGNAVGNANLLRLVRQWFPERIDEVFLMQTSDDGIIPADPQIIAICMRGYRKGSDKNLSEEMAPRVREQVGEKHWKDLCTKAAEEALWQTQNTDSFCSLKRSAEANARRHFTLLKARRDSRMQAGMNDQQDTEIELSEQAAMKVLREPEVSIDTAGVYLLSAEPFWKEPAC
jgi:ATP-dependent helicase HepA